MAVLRQNVQVSSKIVKAIACTVLVRSHVEFCSVAWDPCTKRLIQRIKMVQRHADNLIYIKYRLWSNCTGPQQMINHLSWPGAWHVFMGFYPSNLSFCTSVFSLYSHVSVLFTYFLNTLTPDLGLVPFLFQPLYYPSYILLSERIHLIAPYSSPLITPPLVE